MRVHVLVLNYNGRRLLEECLPSVVDAARASSHDCDVAVIDNASTDGSPAWLAERFPGVGAICRPNRGMCSFNDVVPGLPGPVAVLLNNDIKLDRRAIDPLVEPLTRPRAGERPCFLTAPLCWLFDGTTYEGFRTAVSWRWGLVQATALFPGHEPAIREPGPTASAGAALAVDREAFAALGGFDPLYLPGRLEDLDFAFRGYQAGYRAEYVPEAVAWHRGMASFGPAFGRAGCDGLALRNTLLFQWKNLRHPAHVARQLAGLPLRLAADLLRRPWAEPPRRWAFARALAAAWARWRAVKAGEETPWDSLRAGPCPEGTRAAEGRTPQRRAGNVSCEREFFRRFHPRAMAVAGRGG